MEFENESLELAEIVEFNINEKNFKEMVEIVNDAFQRLSINPNGMSIYYQRNSNGTSILAIKVTQGDDSDTDNYMINGCNVNYYSNDLTCDVYLHANAKSAQKASNLASYISRYIVTFFEKVERDLLDKKLIDLEMSLRMPLKPEESFHEKEQKGIKKFIKTLFTKK